MFERIGVAKQFYKGGSACKTINWVDANRAGHRRKRTGGEAIYTYNPNKGRSGKRNKINSDDLNYQPTVEKTCLVHGP